MDSVRNAHGRKLNKSWFNYFKNWKQGVNKGEPAAPLEICDLEYVLDHCSCPSVPFPICFWQLSEAWCNGFRWVPSLVRSWDFVHTWTFILLVILRHFPWADIYTYTHKGPPTLSKMHLIWMGFQNLAACNEFLQPVSNLSDPIQM